MRQIWLKLKQDWLYLLTGLFPLYFLAALLFLKDPLIWPDEAIYVDTAKGFLQTGRLASNLFGDAVYGLKTIAAWYPPLYFYLLGFWIKLFGSSIESVRSLSLLLASLALINLYYLSKLLFKKRSLALIVMVLVATDYFFGRSSRVARMDMLNFCLLTYAYWAYLKSQTNNQYLWLAGVFAGLAILVHPLGLIGIVVIFCHLILTSQDWRQLWRKLVIFALPVVVACFFWMLTLEGHWQIFLKQWSLQIARKNASISYTLALLKDELVYWKWLFLTFLFAFLFALGRTLVFKKKNDLFLCLGLLISFIMLYTGKELFYPLYYQPFVALVAVSIYALVKPEKPWTKYFFWGSVSIILFLNFMLFYLTLNAYGSNEQDYHGYATSIRKVLPKHGTIYLSALPDPYFVLQNSPGLQFLEFPTMFTTDKQYYELLDQADFVVYNNIFDARLTPYLKINLQKEKAITRATYYDIMVTKLKPKTRRQWPKK